MPEHGFGSRDFELLRAMSEGADAHIAAEVDALWAKAERLVGELGEGLFGTAGFRAAVWPDTSEDERFPFVWARLKRAGNEGFATHIGLFVSPDHCNLCIDLEKDLLDAERSAERLEQVIDFGGSRLSRLLASSARQDLVVWTDTRNVVAATAFESVDFRAFMAANRDHDHPWPKVGYILDPPALCAFGDRWAEEAVKRGRALVPVYDAMIEDFAATQ